ncbi:WXG100 family type VII secretion target [Xylanimonas protaetiae]|uniref:WXG100 family type VII secretion target n=1 Tax=Xylanimonas protaetiae TaxID=2509457 RepID=A0A4P6F9C6_9MICO|nr:WXG100 family type VII secretion target [Xylanimonas protaetiae]QAY69957.1 hypothetical protein ET471_07870 [Xylanimonas protaetiae]
MSNKLGMITTEVRALARSLQTDADELTTISQKITQQLHGVFWKGADAERFRGEWEQTHRAALKQVAAALQDFGHLAKTNADDQDKTSH